MAANAKPPSGWATHLIDKNMNTSLLPDKTVTVTQVVLFTDSDGKARFREAPIALTDGTSAASLSPLTASGGYQLRHSPVGFYSSFHCTTTPQWHQ